MPNIPSLSASFLDSIGPDDLQPPRHPSSPLLSHSQSRTHTDPPFRTARNPGGSAVTFAPSFPPPSPSSPSAIASPRCSRTSHCSLVALWQALHPSFSATPPMDHRMFAGSESYSPRLGCGSIRLTYECSVTKNKWESMATEVTEVGADGEGGVWEVEARREARRDEGGKGDE
ncbi:hypothetical protein FB45DRAFT_859706 [Roridomyces roridus]|uniref:Uncharacterized protein n=1 Tax=Roridomyces roridus TaxID=1738132 RepID=A0AAD7BZH3_9AGAR|nr:hypothetical protein FB45DRAFT_1002403 [Roridomyces roridus]KAJ7651086.1 hypothetical protein FB45DRAFT_859706 [Roridomyces roridus]